MHRLICTFLVRIWQKQVFSWRGSFYFYFQKVGIGIINKAISKTGVGFIVTLFSVWSMGLEFESCCRGFFPNLNGASMHRARHVPPFIALIWLKYCLIGPSPNHPFIECVWIFLRSKGTVWYQNSFVTWLFQNCLFASLRLVLLCIWTVYHKL